MSSDQNGEAGDHEPIYTPPPEYRDRHWIEPTPRPNTNNLFHYATSAIVNTIGKPANWFRQNVVEPNRGPKYYWYHRKFPRVLPIDECYIDDDACMYEANLEYLRVKAVDRATLDMLKTRKENCYFYYKDEKGLNCELSDKCKDLADTYEREELNFFIKYGELPYNANVLHAYTKQKHRMIVERRRAQRLKQMEAHEE